MTAAEVAAHLIQSMKDTADAGKDPANMTTFMRRGEELLTILWHYTGPDFGKAEGPEAIGRIGRALSADLIVMAQDSHLRVTTEKEAELEAAVDRGEVRVSDLPESTEAIMTTAVTPTGGVVEASVLRYGRDDQGRPVWHDDAIPWDAFDITGRVHGGLLRGFRPAPGRPTPVLRKAVEHLTVALRGDILVIPLTDHVRKELGG